MFPDVICSALLSMIPLSFTARIYVCCSCFVGWVIRSLLFRRINSCTHASRMLTHVSQYNSLQNYCKICNSLAKDCGTVDFFHKLIELGISCQTCCKLLTKYNVYATHTILMSGLAFVVVFVKWYIRLTISGKMGSVY